MKSMHILLIHQYYVDDGEGGGARWNQLGKLWAKKGHRLTILAGNSHYMSHQKLSSGNFVNIHGNKIIRTGFVSGLEWLDRTRLWQYFSFMLASIWCGIFSCREKFDLIIVTSPPLSVGISAIILSFWKRIPYIVEIRDLWPESAIDLGMLNNRILIYLALKLEQILYAFSNQIVVLTPAFKQVLIQHKHISAHKIFVIPNSADFELLDSIGQNLNDDDLRRKMRWGNQFVVIYAGAIGIANGLDVVLKAAKELANENVLFVLIGDGSEKVKLSSLTHYEHIRNVQFLEVMSKKEVFKFILASDIGLACLADKPIFKTIYSNKTFDYFSCRKPVLMMIDGLSRMLVEAHHAGIFVIPENGYDLAEKIRYYMSNLALLNTHGENGYLLVKSKFDRVVLAEKYLNHVLKTVEK